MQCARCSHDNSLQARFCEACGAVLRRACSQCGTELSLDARYCAQCGTAADEARTTQPLPGATGHATRLEAERRQLTVLFCDLVGSTELSRKLDPEDLRELVRTYQSACAQVISRYDGHIAQYLGDGLLVYFGYPRAHEDDAQRAVRTGLELVRAVSQLALPGGALSVRVGIHTGLVVVGEVGSGSTSEHLALGDTPNIAARVQSLAQPNEVVMTAATERLVAKMFEIVPLGARALKGVEQPVECYRALAPVAAPTSLDVKAKLTPLVGRDQELGLMLDRWERALEGQGQVLLLVGEPGIGKSRLLRALRDRLGTEQYRWIETRCSPYFTHSPLYPFIDWLPRVLGWSPDDSAESEARKLQERVAALGIEPTEAVPLLASLLSRPIPPQYPLPMMSADRQRRRTLETVVEMILALSSERPVLLAVEDLHWIDPTTLELLGQMVEQAPTSNLLLVLTARPEFEPAWGARSYLTALTLNRLTRRQTEQVVAKLAGGAALPRELAQQIMERTDGVPLFVEELTKAVLESGMVEQVDGAYRVVSRAGALAIPATLQDSLMARLDRMDTAKEVAQLGATIGRMFRYEWLHAVSALDQPALQRALKQLVDAELLFQRGQPPQSSYIFKHALIQDAAHQSLLKSTRQQHHRRIAHALIDRFSDFARTQPEVVAHHLGEAGESEAAIGYWQQAARLAMQRSAHPESVAHLLHALDLIAGLASPAKESHEIDIRVALGFAYIPISGWAAPESVPAFQRALELCGDTGDPTRRFRALLGLDIIYTVRGEHLTALRFGHQAFAIAQQTGDPELLPYAHQFLGWSLVWHGRFREAIQHFQEAIARSDPVRSAAQRAFYGFDVKAVTLRWLSYALLAAGHLDRARQLAVEMLKSAQEVADPHTFVAVHDHYCWMHNELRDWNSTLKTSEEQVTLCEAEGRSFAFFASAARMGRGGALIHLGRVDEGMELIRIHLAEFDVFGAQSSRPRTFANLALGYAKLGQHEKALAYIAEALARCERQEERYWESGIYRIQGEVYLLQDPPRVDLAEASFKHAVEIAQRQQAKLFELQAALELAQLWSHQGKRQQAREGLAPIYDWFTEGFDTKDLQDAKALLEELRR